MNIDAGAGARRRYSDFMRSRLLVLVLIVVLPSIGCSPREAQARKIFNQMVADADISMKGSRARLLLKDFGDTSFVKENRSMIENFKKIAEDQEELKEMSIDLNENLRLR